VLIRFVQQHSRTHRLEGGTKLRFAMNLEKDEQRFVAVEELLEALSKPAVPPPPPKKGSKQR
jgi:transcription-repair coupling factor (superfamily II helicase)